MSKHHRPRFLAALLCGLFLHAPAFAQLADDSALIGHTLPSALDCDEIRPASITLRNTGTNTWHPDDCYQLVALDEPQALYSPLPILLEDLIPIATNDTGTFRMSLQAPVQAGSYVTSWRMTTDPSCGGNGDFGVTVSQAIEVTCQGNPPPPGDQAEIVTHTLPPTLACGETVPVSVVVRNAGNTLWTAEESIKLGSPGGSDPFRFDTRLELPTGVRVEPGDTYSFDFTLTAEEDMSGTFLTDWRMIREGSHWFGPIASSSVDVACVPKLRIRQDGLDLPIGSTFQFPPTPLSELPISREFDLCNVGTGNLTLDTQPVIAGTGFSQIGTPPFLYLQPGVCTQIRVRFQVSAAGDYTGSITEDYNNEPVYVVNLAASAFSAQSDIRVMQNGTEISDGGTFSFPSTPVASLPISRVFDICNDGDEDLELTQSTSMVSGSGFSQIADPSVTVIPGDCTTTRVRFQVGSGGTYQGALTIANNDPDENPFDVQLVGIATAQAPEISVRWSTYDLVTGDDFLFPLTNVQTPTSRLFKICNDGPGTLELENHLTLVSGSAFSQIVDPPSAVAPGTCGDLRVRLYANDPGYYYGEIRIESNDANENPFVISLAGPVDYF